MMNPDMEPSRSMPFSIIRDDLTCVHADAIVSPDDVWLSHGGGASARIFKAAGEAQMTEACRAVTPCEIGGVAVTPGFALPARYVFHTVGPVWKGGNQGEHAILRSCYMECMQMAVQMRLKSIVFPLIAAGTFGYPRQDALRVAMDCFRLFLMQSDVELQITLVLYDTESCAAASHLWGPINNFLFDRRRPELCFAESCSFDDGELTVSFRSG